MILSITFDSIQSALDTQHGKGGWFWWNYNDGTVTWFPYTTTQDEILNQVQGSGYLSTWSGLEVKANGPIGGPRGQSASPLG